MPERPPDAYAPKVIVAIESEDPGWLVEYVCHHIVWWAVEPRVGEKALCAICLDHLIEEYRRAPSGPEANALSEVNGARSGEGGKT